MGRTQLSARRLSAIRESNIGRIIIFCEGKTEKYYFDYFAGIIKKNKYNDVEVVLETADGNAQTVLNYAERFMADEKNCHKFNHYGRYLAFDCDDPPNIQAVIINAKDYELLISNYLFETWLLMHFEEVKGKLSKRQIYHRLSEYLHGDYTKGDRGILREIIQNGNIEKAIDNAETLARQFAAEGKSVLTDIGEMNPYTSVHKLIEQFMAVISGS